MSVQLIFSQSNRWKTPKGNWNNLKCLQFDRRRRKGGPFGRAQSRSPRENDTMAEKFKSCIWSLISLARLPGLLHPGFSFSSLSISEMINLCSWCTKNLRVTFCCWFVRNLIFWVIILCCFFVFLGCGDLWFWLFGFLGCVYLLILGDFEKDFVWEMLCSC